MEAIMDTIVLILTIIQLVMSVSLVTIVLFQSGRTNNLGSIGGVADSFLSKGKASTIDAKLVKVTAWGAGIYMTLTLFLSLI